MFTNTQMNNQHSPICTQILYYMNNNNQYYLPNNTYNLITFLFSYKKKVPEQKRFSMITPVKAIIMMFAFFLVLTVKADSLSCLCYACCFQTAEKEGKNEKKQKLKCLPVQFFRESTKRKKKRHSAPPRDMPALHSMLPPVVSANCE